MNKQEKVRADTSGLIRLGICAYQHLGFDSLEMYDKIADEVLKILNARGVVIKVGDDIEIELTDGTKIPSFCKYEPLIKEGK